MKAIILAGGSGTRLWPLSRSKYPKQFIKLQGIGNTLFQMAIQRCLNFCGPEDIYVVTNRDYEFVIQSQLEELGYRAGALHVLLEPFAKNTLPAIFNGVKEIRKQGDDVTVVFPSDHMIHDPSMLINSIIQGKELAKEFIFSFGIVPTFPEVGYGYIKPGEKLAVGYRIAEFKEKPDFETAKQYIAADYYWNSGMFMFDSALFNQEVQKWAPEVYNAFQADSVEDCFRNCPKISIDYGVMEKTGKSAMIPLEMDWDDLGNFSSFFEEYAEKRDENNNILLGEEIAIDSSNNLVYGIDGRLCALVGVQDLVVIDQRDAMLICHKDRTPDVKAVVDALKSAHDSRIDYHVTEYRPWGSFTILENGDFYKIKRLTILPGKQLSYQMHYHRSEHWIVVSGTATVTKDDENVMVRSGENIFINIGEKHRLKNEGKMTLEVIEVQSGHYLGEDDIVRFCDDFGRC